VAVDGIGPDKVTRTHTLCSELQISEQLKCTRWNVNVSFQELSD